MVRSNDSAPRRRTRDLVTAALITALMAVTGWVALPLGAVPVTLQTFGVALAALLLPPGWAAGSLALYVVLGAIGVPVLAGGQAGLAVVLGPTGGYLMGFVAGAGLGSVVRVWTRSLGAPSLLADAAGGFVLIGVVYGIGTVWLAASLNLSFGAAVLAGVVPFVAGDVAKVAAAIVVATGVRAAGVRS
jgi:biotin transport system substrate-specific component